MASGIYAVVHVGNKKLFVSDVSHLGAVWPKILAQLNSGTYPDREVQDAWNREKGKRRFSFHLKQDLVGNPEILGRDRLCC
jgi:hypothetical protein